MGGVRAGGWGILRAERVGAGLPATKLLQGHIASNCLRSLLRGLFSAFCCHVPSYRSLLLAAYL
eukprot:771196-Amphidinium_carterae.1